MDDLFKELKAETTFLAGHLYRANWQFQQFDSLRRMTPFPQNTVCMVLDFAENFTCTYQDEVQAAHWHHNQVTVHPIVCYYACSHCQQPLTDSLVFISDDRNHDHHAVHAFTLRAVEHLRDARNISLEHIVQWTDGCSSQYKSKGPFADISRALQDYGCTFERNFFGSRHGKGPADGESAVVKSSAMRAIKSGQVVTDAEGLFQFCQSSGLNKQPNEAGCQHFLRSFFFVSHSDIHRDRHRPVQTLKGTRSLHAVKCVSENVLMTRTLSCSCGACLGGIGVCLQQTAGKVEPWQERTLNPITTHAVTLPSASAATVIHVAAISNTESTPLSVADVDSSTADDGAAFSSPVGQNTVLSSTVSVLPDDDGNPDIHASVDAEPNALEVADTSVGITFAEDVPFHAVRCDVSPVCDDQSASPCSATNPSFIPSALSGAIPSANDDFSHVDDASVNPCSRLKEDVESLKEGDFVQVEFEGRRRKVVYYGKILSFEADRVRVRFLERVQSTDKFTWADTDYIMQEQIVGKVKQPELAEGRGVLFVFK